MAHKDSTVETWYPELIMLAASPDEDIRVVDAQVLGEDPTQPQFHETLLDMLHDESIAVRSQAALSLVRFDDPSGHEQIINLLEPMVVKTPYTGRVMELARVGASVARNGLLARLERTDGVAEIHSPIAGKVRSVSVQPHEHVFAGAELLTLNASSDQVWRALRALATIGRPEDLSPVNSYARLSADIPDRVRQQATLTDKAIRERASRK